MIKRIQKDDLITLIFLNLFFHEKINFININSDANSDANSDFLNNISEIPEYYKDLAEMFSKKKFYTLSSHRDHLDHHIPLEKNTKSIFNSIYNLLEIELKVLKNYIEEKLVKN